MAANTWAVAILWYSAGMVECKTDKLKLKVLDKKTRKLMTLYGALHLKRGGRGPISCEMCVKAEENNPAWYVRNPNEILMAGVRKINILDSEGAKGKNEFARDGQNASLNRWTPKNVWSISAGNARDS